MNKKLSFLLLFGVVNFAFAQTKSLQPTTGLNFPFVDFLNSFGGGIVFPLQLLLILSIITLSPAFFGFDDFLFKDSNSIGFY
ncbi:hypothetical protein Q7M_281 [Borrelia crocidurae str. Achema]|uniref:Uncharacterized protein n=1 Tax=Borrelia crocidurae (strain Achema) TaxID=1155096 RepID=I0FC54_BORCA|nr:hypothetical protein Q7M_281 [Borrelia crocidurae str. Achema]